MATDFAGIHEELRTVARDLLAKERAEWALLAQVGWIGLEAAESHGGSEVSFAEVAVILDEMGRAAAPSSYLGGAVLAVGVLNALAPSASRDELLARVISGESLAAVALPTDGTTRPLFGLDGPEVSGYAEFVPDAGEATDLLLLARDREGAPVVVHAAKGGAGLWVARQPVLDETRRLATVSADRMQVADGAVWRFAGDERGAVDRLFDRARTAVACDSLGLSEAMLAATVAYAGVREQFGRPIGSFQAVKHACADMLVQVAVGRRLVGAAVDAVATGSAGATAAAQMAKAHACSTAVEVVGKAMQLHGGIGYTWESGIHVYLKRATLNRSLFGSPAHHRKQLAARYL